MTLLVWACWTNPETGVTEEFTDWEGGRYRAGVERDRTVLWGAEAVRRRGATFLSQLAESDLWVAPEEMEAFVAEVRGLLADLDSLLADLGWPGDTSVPHDLSNILRAAEYARAKGGGVNIT